jgi:hypothetical protein
MDQPAGALADPVHLIEQAVADQVALVQLGIVIPVGVFWRGPARNSPNSASGSSRSAPVVIWCTRAGESPAAAASVRIETPSAPAEASA